TAGGANRQVANVLEALSGEATVWDARTGKALLELNGHTGLVLSAAFSPDGTRVVTGSGAPTARAGDARHGTRRHERRGGRGGVGRGVVTAGGVLANPTTAGPLTGATSSQATVWDARTGEALVELKGFQGTITCVAISQDGTRVVTGGVAATKRARGRSDV